MLNKNKNIVCVCAILVRGLLFLFYIIFHSTIFHNEHRVTDENNVKKKLV